jgi:hypothetical protein
LQPFLFLSPVEYWEYVPIPSWATVGVPPVPRAYEHDNSERLTASTQSRSEVRE